jgi:hypothetical protein
MSTAWPRGSPRRGATAVAGGAVRPSDPGEPVLSQALEWRPSAIGRARAILICPQALRRNEAMNSQPRRPVSCAVRACRSESAGGRRCARERRRRLTRMCPSTANARQRRAARRAFEEISNA